MKEQPDFNSKVSKRVEIDQEYDNYIADIKDDIFTIGTLDAVLKTYAKDKSIPLSEKVFQYQDLLPIKREELNKKVDSAIEHIVKLVSEEIELLSDED